MKIKDIRKLSEEDIDSKIVESKKELIKLNSQVATGTTPKSPGELKKYKKTIARLLTIKKERTTNK